MTRPGRDQGDAQEKAFGFLSGLAFWFLIAALQALGGAVTDNPSAIVSTQTQR